MATMSEVSFHFLFESVTEYITFNLVFDMNILKNFLNLPLNDSHHQPTGFQFTVG